MQRPVSISESPSVTAQEAEYAEKNQVVCCFGKQGMRDVYVGGKGL